jgi:tartrate dehydrogenase/decarboxylase/D-malate dehydrogenase
MHTYHIAIYPGDGIGTEVLDQAVSVLDRVQAADGRFRLALTTLPWGAAYWREHGRVAPQDYLQTLRSFDAILLGAVGWPAEIPDGVTLAPLIGIRQAFDQYACVRPTRLLPGVRSLLADKRPGDIDLVVIRENSEGEYVDLGGRFRRGQPDEHAVQSAIHTRRGIERALRFGFEMARTRRKRLTMITKSNALKHAFTLWEEILEEIAVDFPEIAADRQHCDAAAMNLVRCPEQFDVIVASNLFGDLLTDLAGAVGGGLGLAPSANINPERKFPSLFEPVHGSAPDIAGQGIANPVAAILSAAMMLEFLGESQAARRITQAVEGALAEGCRTRDLGGALSTAEMGAAIVERV